MGLKNMTLEDGAEITVGVGTDLVFAATGGANVANGILLTVPDDTNYQTRRSLVAKVRQYSIDSKTGEAGKDKKSLVFVIPAVLASGRVVYNTLRIEREVHPTTDPAVAASMNIIGAQLLTALDLAAYWSYGSLD